MTLPEWQTRGAYHEVHGIPVFALDEGPREAPVVVVLHGYPSCSYDYYRVLPYWTKDYRVVVHDHPGFGLSGKPADYSYSLIEQAEIALGLWAQLGIREAHLLAHDYGTSVATEIIARRQREYEPVRLLGATLGNGSMLIELSQLRWIQKLLLHRRLGPLVAKFSSKALFDLNMRRLWGDQDKVEQQDLDLLWEMLIRDQGRQRLPQLTQYIRERRRFWHRWVGSLYRTDLPVNLLWAEEDPVAVIKMAHELHRNIPDSRLKLLPGIGHYPMLESPEVYAQTFLEMLREWD